MSLIYKFFEFGMKAADIKHYYDMPEEEFLEYLETEQRPTDVPDFLYKKFNQEAKEICPNDEERLNIIIDICYGNKGNKQFCWDCIGQNIIDRLEEIGNVHTE